MDRQVECKRQRRRAQVPTHSLVGRMHRDPLQWRIDFGIDDTLECVQGMLFVVMGDCVSLAQSSYRLPDIVFVLVPDPSLGAWQRDIPTVEICFWWLTGFGVGKVGSSERL